MKQIFRKSILGMFATLALLAGSCSAPKNVTYFQELEPGSIQQVIAKSEFRIKPDDKLQITIYAQDEQLNRLFNLGYVNSRIQTNVAQTGSSAKLRTFAGSVDAYSQYTVSSKGTIDFPVLGEIKVAGMTREELAGFIKGELEGRDLAKDPIVIVEFMSMGVNVLGEVRVPGRYDINTNSMTILEALSLAGDANITADREHVMVLREKDGQMEVYTIDLTKGKEMLQSPVYYLEQGDVVYVEPNTMRKRSTTVNGNQALSASFWVTVASLLTSVAVLIFK